VARRIVRWTLLAAVVMLMLRVSGCAERLFYHPIREATPAPTGAPGSRVVRFESADGTKLCGWFVPASSAPSAPALNDAERVGNGAPSLFFVHGNAGNMNWHYGFVEELPRLGFNLFLFDYRGYGESEGSAWSRGPLIDDTRAAFEAMLEQQEVDASRVGMFAQSLGAALALNAIRDSDPVRVAVLESPFASWRLAAATAIGGNSPGPIARGLSAALIADDRRPDEAIRSLRFPVLVIHGDADRIVPVVHGRLLRDAASDRVTLVEFAGGDHNTLRDTHPEATRRMIEFLRRHLAESGDPASAGPQK